jgi:hypothetical protein
LGRSTVDALPQIQGFSVGDGLKSSIRQELSRRFSVALLTPDEEWRDSKLADREIADSYRQVRSYLREKNADGLWQKHNIEYGFYRNLLGCRIGWVVLSLAAFAFAVANASHDL